jgi:eukaryotic-like serine/threonine-protein kinase
MSGDSSRAETLANDLDIRFPEDTAVQFSYLPVIRARLALNRGNASKAIELLQTAVPHELGVPPSAISGLFGALYPIYMRGEAYLVEHRGAEAAAEFKKVLDHPGIVVADPQSARWRTCNSAERSRCREIRPRQTLRIRISARSGKTPIAIFLS